MNKIIHGPRRLKKESTRPWLHVVTSDIFTWRPKKTMAIQDRLSNLSIKAKIKLFNLVLGLTFLLILVVMTISLSYTRRVLVNNVSTDIETVAENAQVARDLVVLFSESNLLFHTFYGREQYLRKEGNSLLEKSRALVEQSAADHQLKKSILHLVEHLQNTLSFCADLNIIRQEKIGIEERIYKEFDMLDEIITQKTISQIFTGKDTSFLEQLSVQIINYRYTLLEINKNFTEWFSRESTSLDVQAAGISPAIDEFLLDLQRITTFDRQTAEHGKHLIAQVKKYKNILARHMEITKKINLEVKAFNEAKSMCIEVLKNTDTNLVNSTKDTLGKISTFFLVLGAGLLFITFLIMGSVLFSTSYFLRSAIYFPMERLKKILTTFSQGELTARIKVERSDEWGLVEKMLNKMADDLLASQHAVRQSEEKYREIFNTPADSIFLHDADSGAIVDVNQAVLEVFGYSYEEVLQQDLGTLSSGKHPYTMEVAIKNVNCAKQEGPQLFEWRAKRKNGELFWAEVGLKASRFSGRDYVIAIVRNITDRKKAEQNLASERERLAVTLGSIGDGVITTDTHGTVLFLNKVAEQLTGWTNEEAQGRPSTEVFNIINEKTKTPCASPIQRVLELGKIIGLANHTALIARNGAVRSIADSGAPIRDRRSKIIGVVLVFRDVTHEQKMEEELLRTRKLESVGVLAAGIAHDFNNILSAILGNIDLAARLINGEEHACSLLSDARKATERATKLTRQLLTFAKGGDPVKENTNLTELIRESGDFVLHGTHISCTYSCADDLWPVSVDVGQIGQVIQNIILNARHAMPEGGKIEVHCTNVEDAAYEALLNIHKGRFVRITIQDHGVGIPQEIIDKIFDPYFTTKQEGSGLGLAICHSIIAKHDGYLTVRSRPGRGSKFSIYLPASNHAGVEATEKQQDGLPPGSARIMVMDDEEMLRKVAESQLIHFGHEVILVKDGAEAVKKYRELMEQGTPVDLIIMDLTIPGAMGGKEAVREILKINTEAKVIVASGYSNDPIMANCTDYGFVASVSKPFDLKELNKVLTTALK